MQQIMIEEYILILVKVLIVLTLLVYNIFAVLMSRQIGIMTKTVSMRDSGIITLFGYVHLVFAILVLVLSFVSL